MIWFAIPPLIIRVRKKIAKKKGIDYKPLFPKTKEKVELVKKKFNFKKNEK
tara:strand:- start:27 stop:179 length:153 start_codon:yes stop_codon:yes gene_type:complete